MPHSHDAAGLIHDMRNMVSAVATNCSILAESLPDEQSSMTLDIYEAMFQLASMMDRLSDREPKKTPRVHVGNLIEETTRLFSKSYPKVTFSWPKREADMEWRIDRCDLFRIVMNLVSNASEAAMGNKSQNPRVAVVVDPDDMSISVADSGNGFGSPKANSAFLPFMKARESESCNHEGLGLYVVHSIAESYAGQVTITRTESETVLKVRFPSRVARPASRLEFRTKNARVA